MLAAVAFAAAGAAAQDRYDLVLDDAWQVDFRHAGTTGNATFPEVTSGGVCVLDYDGDGWEDLFFVNGKYGDLAAQAAMDPRSALYRNEAGRGFARVAGALEISSWGQGCAAGDYDADGDPDVAVSTWGGTLLYRNLGGGAFANATASAGIRHEDCGGAPCFGTSLAWLDYDGDRDLDLFVLNYADWHEGIPTVPNYGQTQCNVLWRNDGGGRFSNVTMAAGVADCDKNAFALAIADVDDDGRQDVFIASDETNDTLLMNRGGTFEDVSGAAGVADYRGGMGATWGDYSGDGRLDLAIPHFEGERFALYQRDGAALRWTDRAVEDGLESTLMDTGWGAEFADYDLDGHLDLLLANGHVSFAYANDRPHAQTNKVFRNNREGRLVDVSDRVWHPAPVQRVSRGLQTADFDRDGYLDVVVASNANETPELWRSAGGPNNWLALRLAGNETMDPHALGARVRVELGDRAIVREVVAASSYLGQSSRDVRIGLGAAGRADRVVVEWPDGTEQELGAMIANRFLSVKAGDAPVVLVERPVATARAGIVTDRLARVPLEAEIVRAAGGAFDAAWTVGGAVTPGRFANVTFATLGRHEPVFSFRDGAGVVEEALVEVDVLNVPPVADGVVPAAAVRGAALVLDASASHDPDDRVVSWTWRIGDDVVDGERVTYAFRELGTLRVVLTVADADGGTDSVEFFPVVSNAGPVARPGGPYEARLLRDVTLDGSASGDPDGRLVAWRWDFGDGTAALGERVAKRYGAAGTFVARLTVTDDDGATAEATTTVVVDGAKPVADAGGDRVGDRVTAVRFDAGASFDPNGAIASHAWDFGDGESSTTAVVDHAYPRLGDYVVTLTVTDDEGLTDSDVARVTVRNLPPVVDSGGALAQDGLAAVTFAAKATDADGVVVAYEWDFGDGARAVGREAVHAYAALGRYAARVTVRDNEGLTTTAARSVWLYARPAAAPGPDGDADRLTDVVFDGSSSTDADGRVVAWAWDFGDGATGEGAIARHRYRALGAFVARLTVTDDDGWTGSATATVTVRNVPPTAAIDGFDLANVEQRLAWDAAPSTDPDGRIVRWRWTIDDGTGADGPRVEHAFAAVGSSSVRLLVEDDDGATATTEVAVEVVDWLRVRVAMDREEWAATDRPTGVVTALYANGLPVAGADVTVDVAYVVRAHPGASDRVLLASVSGSTAEDGRYPFEVPAVAPLPVDGPGAQPPTGLGAAKFADGWSHHEATARVAWRGNDGRDAARYGVRAVGGA